MKYESRVTRITVAPVGEPICAETVLHIEIDEEGGGEYLRIVGQRCTGEPHDAEAVTIDPEEWPVVKAAVETLLKGIADYEKRSNEKVAKPLAIPGETR